MVITQMLFIAHHSQIQPHGLILAQRFQVTLMTHEWRLLAITSISLVVQIKVRSRREFSVHRLRIRLPGSTPAQYSPATLSNRHSSRLLVRMSTFLEGRMTVRDSSVLCTALT